MKTEGGAGETDRTDRQTDRQTEDRNRFPVNQPSDLTSRAGRSQKRTPSEDLNWSDHAEIVSAVPFTNEFFCSSQCGLHPMARPCWFTFFH